MFKLENRCHGLESANAFVRFMNDKVEGSSENDRDAILGHFSRENEKERDRQTGEAPVRIGDGLTEIGLVHLQVRQQRGDDQPEQRGRVPIRRGDRWLEVELGSFYNEEGEDGAVEAWLMGREGYQGKSGLIVQGIEFRPKL